ncbi:flagellar basal body L-ring protein FlgH [Marinobacter maritimus]|uniref:flagellar basal body L-ring protein FlgH n=1 Tax=Marinobacter maritimus TaxID=277961 RepID=UPI00119D1A2C|nr:flagellar basal body L-ring protein FlgH [Marinobacter maritimus]
MKAENKPANSLISSVQKIFPVGDGPIHDRVELPSPDDLYFATLIPAEKGKSSRITGSLFDQNRSSNLYIEKNYFDVGDIIYVEINELTKADKKASTKISKNIDLDLKPIGIPGGNLKAGSDDFKLNISQKNDQKSSGNVGQENKLQGRVTVAVVQRFDNGNLLVRGDKWVQINSGNEYIRISGLIRYQDIDSDNVIDSSKIANARIEYSGTGGLSESQKPGWFMEKLGNSEIWPF